MMPAKTPENAKPKFIRLNDDKKFVKISVINYLFT
jgi:hypothetical protein